MSVETLIGGLNRDEKLTAMDLIWRDLAADSQSFVSPEWHKRIIADRLQNPNPRPALPLAEAKAEIKEAMDARSNFGLKPATICLKVFGSTSSSANASVTTSRIVFSRILTALRRKPRAIKRDRSNFPESRPGDGHGETSSNWTCPVDLPPGSHLPLFAMESAVLKLKESALPDEQESAIRHGNAQRLLAKDGAVPEP